MKPPTLEAFRLATALLAARCGPRATAVEERLDAVGRLARLRERCGEGPLSAVVCGRPLALVLSRADAERLRPADDPTAVVRAGGFGEAAVRVANGLAGEVDKALLWAPVLRAWRRTARQAVLGRAARSDGEVSALVAGLRPRALWPVSSPVRMRHRRRLVGAVTAYRQDENPEDLIGALAAFDVVGGTVMRALAVLGSHPEDAERARSEPDHLRACLLDTARLWPTVPLLLRVSAQETAFGDTVFPAGTVFMVYVPFLNRDPESPNADSFRPSGVSDAGADAVAAVFLGRLLERFDLLPVPELRPGALPFRLDHRRLEVGAARRPGSDGGARRFLRSTTSRGGAASTAVEQAHHRARGDAVQQDRADHDEADDPP